MAEAKLYQAIDKGEAWAIALTLRTLGKNHGYTGRTEVGLVSQLSRMSDAELARLGQLEPFHLAEALGLRDGAGSWTTTNGAR